MPQTAQPAGRWLLLILSDGKPNDLDEYEGRYGVEDTRQAVQAARRLGLQPSCVTIDEKGKDYSRTCSEPVAMWLCGAPPNCQNVFPCCTPD